MPASNGSGGSGGGAGAGGSLGTGGSGGDPATEDAELIDDFEDGDIEILPVDARVGFWYSYNEEDERPMAAAPVAADAGLALHAAGSHKGGVTPETAYGGVGVDLNNQNLDGAGPRSTSREVYDASDYDGFQFRIRASSNDGTRSIRFEIVTTEVAEASGGGDCTGDNCWDAYGQDIALTAQWRTVKVPFMNLVQEGWGQTKSFDPAHILGVAFEDQTTGSWDYWIDDLTFYVDEPDPGTGGTGGTTSGGGGTGSTTGGGGTGSTSGGGGTGSTTGGGGTGSTSGGGGGSGGGSSCPASWGAEPNGSITWYTFSQGTAAIGDINCSYGIQQNPDRVSHVDTGSGQYFAAMNTTDYDTAAACGACVEVSTNTGSKVTVTVVDQCPIGSNPKCVKGHIDLSKAAYDTLGLAEGYWGQRAGKGSISWKYVACPTSGNVTFQLKENNPNWNMVIIEGHKYPIAKVEVQVNGQWLNATREEFNYWLPPGGRMGTYLVRATDIYGDVIQEQLSNGTSEVNTGEQFSCQ